MSALTPISREKMCQMNAEEIEKQRQQMIQNIVSNIYYDAIRHAKTSTETSYKYLATRLPQVYHQFNGNDMNDIIENLKQLFPDSSVSQATFVRGADGKQYDISTLDEKLLPFINKQNGQMHIVIDWS